MVAFASFYIKIAGIVSYIHICLHIAVAFSNAGHIIHYVGLDMSIIVGEKNVRTLQTFTAMFQVFGANFLRLFQQSVHESVTMHGYMCSMI